MTLDPKRKRPLAGLLVLLVGLSFAAPPAFAAEPAARPAPEPAATPHPTLVEAAEAAVEAMPAATLASAVQTLPEPAGVSNGKPFFKTGRGAAVLVLMAAGLGYTIYSFSDDRVKSPNK